MVVGKGPAMIRSGLNLAILIMALIKDSSFNMGPVANRPQKFDLKSFLR